MDRPVLEGSLTSFRLPGVLTFLNGTRKTGTLTLTEDGKSAFIFFDEGNLIYAGSDRETFRLGAILLRKRHVTREQHETIDAIVTREGRRYGEIAVERGILTEAALRDALKMQVSEILYDCFVWKGGTFAFAERMQLPDYAVTIAVDLSNLIMEGARRIEEWEECLRLLPDRSVIFRIVSNPHEEKITLTAEEWKILFLINGARTLEDLCHDADEDPFTVYRVVYGLHANKLIEVAPRPDDSQSIRAEETIRQPPAQFGSDSTVTDPPDDSDLLLTANARLSYRDVVKPVAARLNEDAGGKTFPLVETEYLVGRSSENHIQIPDPGVSSYHARIFRGPEGYVIEDLKSRNGVWLNGMRIFHAVLQNGDRLRLGTTDLTFELLV